MNDVVSTEWELRISPQDNFFDRKTLNLDITFRCPLQCLRCGRQTSFLNKGKRVPGKDMTLEEFDKITNFFQKISFCGQYSDPIHHPQFLDFLQICREKRIYTEVHTASSHKPNDWYVEAWQTYPGARWIFAIDGLPHQSHKYRINQDGIKLFNLMLESRKYLERKVIWQYIVFFYNQHSIKEAMEIAKKEELRFDIINSSRWINENDYLRPTIRV